MDYTLFDERNCFSYVDNPPVYCIQPADVIGEDYKDSPAVLSKLSSLKASHSHYRRVRADGNCYYRAVFYAYLEKLMTLGANHVKDFKDRIAKKEGAYKCSEDGIVQVLVGHLNQLYERLQKEGLEKGLLLLFKMITFSQHFDDVTVRFLRQISANFMNANPKASINGLALSEAVMSEFSSLQDFISNCVLKENEHASLLVLVVIPALLRISIDVAIFDNRDDSKLSIQSYPAKTPFTCNHPDSLNLHSQKISLLYKPGHYDIIYDKSLTQKCHPLTVYDKCMAGNFNPNMPPGMAEGSMMPAPARPYGGAMMDRPMMPGPARPYGGAMMDGPMMPGPARPYGGAMMDRPMMPAPARPYGGAMVPGPPAYQPAAPLPGNNPVQSRPPNGMYPRLQDFDPGELRIPQGALWSREKADLGGRPQYPGPPQMQPYDQPRMEYGRPPPMAPMIQPGYPIPSNAVPPPGYPIAPANNRPVPIASNYHQPIYQRPSYPPAPSNPQMYQNMYYPAQRPPAARPPFIPEPAISCSFCRTTIPLGSETYLNCAHAFHLECLKYYKPNQCPAPGCGARLSPEELALFSGNPAPVKAPQPGLPIQPVVGMHPLMAGPAAPTCNICQSPFEDPKKQMVNHCKNQNRGCHRGCFETALASLTDDKVLLTKSEEPLYMRNCPLCNEKLTEDNIKKLIDADKFKHYKQNRDERDKEERKKQEEEKRNIIKLKCCGMSLNKREFIQQLMAEKRVALQDHKAKNLWLCPTCQKAMHKVSLKDLYGLDSGVKFIEKFCGACGRLFEAGEQAEAQKCSHKFCGQCKAAMMMCLVCSKIK